ncbi:MAG: LamG-like jellyroll fold domain-containing protein, partial [Caldilineaceae bacterium]
MSGSGEPDDNPAPGRNYFQYMNNFYVEIRYPQEIPTAYWIDEMEFSQTSELENDISISSVWVGYWATTGKWEIGFEDNSFNSVGYNNNSQSTFEIRYSVSPITNANYSSATLITPIYNLNGTGRINRPNTWKKPTWTQFSLPSLVVQNNSKIYFAIKDVSSTASGDGHNAPSSNIRTIDYNIRPSEPDTEPPTSPTSLVATSPSQSSISVSWNPATDNVSVAGYIVERCQGTGCSNFTQVGTPTASPFVDTGLTANTFYNYHVRATDAAGNLSGWSNVVGATTLAPDTQAPTVPTNLTATAASSSTINLTWTASTDNVSVTGYQVERCSGASCSTFTQVGTPSSNSFSDTGLSATTLYRYRVRATDGGNNLSNYSNIESATTPEAPPISANLEAGYNFDEASGNAIDISGHSRNATLQNGATRTTGKTNSGLSLDGTDDFASLGTWSIAGSAITVSAWVKADDWKSSEDVRILSKASDTTEQGHTWMLSETGNLLRFRLKTNGTTSTLIANSGTLPTNTWTHVAAVYDGSMMKLYQDGVEVGSQAKTGTLDQNTQAIHIGNNPDNSNHFDGVMDDVRIYNKALTQTEIQTDMNTPLTQGGSGTPTPCNTVTTTNFSQSAYNGYGAPYDAFQTSTNLINASCSSSDSHTIQATLGQTGDTTRIVYTKGYYYDPGIADWHQFTGTCTGALNGDWCQGSITTSITDADISTASATDPAYLVGMTCSV